MPLQKKQIKQLRTLAHKLKPVIWVGQNGLSDNVLKEVEAALLAHELIKIKLRAGDRDEHRALMTDICSKTGAEEVHAIGNTVSLFRRHPDKPLIKLD